MTGQIEEMKASTDVLTLGFAYARKLREQNVFFTLSIPLIFDCQIYYAFIYFVSVNNYFLLVFAYFKITRSKILYLIQNYYSAVTKHF